jgi:hypothetical protein
MASPRPANPYAAPRRRFFLGIALYALAVSLLGFAKTFFLPLATGQGSFHWIVMVHGAAFFAWMLLFTVQAALVPAGQWRWHRRLGLASVPLALVMVASCIAVGALLARAELAGRAENGGVDGFAGVVGAMAVFALLYTAALLQRQRPEVHKRLMFLATVAILWPAWFRFRHYFPEVPRPELTFGLLASDAVIAVAMLRDRLRFGRVHPVLLWVGTALFLEHVLELALFGTPAWRALSLWLLGS